MRGTKLFQTFQWIWRQTLEVSLRLLKWLNNSLTQALVHCWRNLLHHKATSIDTSISLVLTINAVEMFYMNLPMNRGSTTWEHLQTIAGKSSMSPFLSNKGDLNRSSCCVWWNFKEVFTLSLSQMVTQWALTFMLQVYMILWKFATRHWSIKDAHPYSLTMPRVIKCKPEELERLGLLPQPHYSSDHGRSDYHLFRAMTHFLRGQMVNVDEAENKCRECFTSKLVKWYKYWIELSGTTIAADTRIGWKIFCRMNAFRK